MKLCYTFCFFGLLYSLLESCCNVEKDPSSMHGRSHSRPAVTKRSKVDWLIFGQWGQ